MTYFRVMYTLIPMCTHLQYNKGIEVLGSVITVSWIQILTFYFSHCIKNAHVKLKQLIGT